MSMIFWTETFEEGNGLPEILAILGCQIASNPDLINRFG
jgi:hypothetical protein